MEFQEDEILEKEEYILTGNIWKVTEKSSPACSYIYLSVSQLSISGSVKTN